MLVGEHGGGSTVAYGVLWYSPVVFRLLYGVLRGSLEGHLAAVRCCWSWPSVGVDVVAV